MRSATWMCRILARPTTRRSLRGSEPDRPHRVRASRQVASGKRSALKPSRPLRRRCGPPHGIAPRKRACEQARNENSTPVNSRLVAEILLCGALACFVVPSLAAQPRPDEVRFHVGTATFFEARQHVTLGGSYRMYFGKRGWGIEPEYSAMIVPDHTDNMLALSLVKDLSRPASKRVWYMSMGGGLNHQRGSRTSGTHFPAALAWGVGVKIRAGQRWYVAPQARIGFEPNIRFSVFFGRATQ